MVHNYGIKIDANTTFHYPDADALTDQMPYTFTRNVTSEFIAWFMWGFILQMVAIGGALLGCVASALRNA